MDYTEEKQFIRSFVKKSRRKRLLHELTTPEKRYRAVSRFCHNAHDLVDGSKIILEGYGKEMSSFVNDHPGLCYALSPDFWMDEQYLPLKDAVHQAAMCTDAVLILGKGFAVIFGEAEKGGRDCFLLAEKKIKQ